MRIGNEPVGGHCGRHSYNYKEVQWVGKTEAGRNELTRRQRQGNKARMWKRLCLDLYSQMEEAEGLGKKKGSCWGFLWFSALLFCFKIKGLKQNNIQNSTTAERKKQPAAQIRCPSRRCSWWLTKPFQQKVPHTTGRMSAEKQWHVWSMAPWFCSRKRNPHVRPCCTFYILICL